MPPIPAVDAPTRPRTLWGVLTSEGLLYRIEFRHAGDGPSDEPGATSSPEGGGRGLIWIIPLGMDPQVLRQLT